MVVLLIGSQTLAFAQRPIAPVTRANASQPVPSITSHRAVYAISLARATQHDGVRSASGKTTYAVTDRCNGYTIETNMQLDLGMSTGNDSEMKQQYVAWESKDNRTSTFRMLSHENGTLRDSYHGSVALDEKGAGTITYVDAAKEPNTIDLPAGTLLSTAHTVALLKAAERGDTFFTRPVVDGTLDDGPYKVAAVIGPEPRGALQAGSRNPLEAGAARSFAMAYFAADGGDEPRYEISMDIYPNGIAKHMVQDFGDFTLAFDLVSIEPIDNAPNCP